MNQVNVLAQTQVCTSIISSENRRNVSGSGMKTCHAGRSVNFGVKRKITFKECQTFSEQ